MFCSNCGYDNASDASYCGRCGTPLQKQPQTAAPANSRPLLAQPYAGFWKRFLASLLDGIIVNTAAGIIGVAFALAMVAEGKERFAIGYVIWWLARILGDWLYSALMESSSKQATLGKLALGIRVCDQQGQRISFGRATGRHFGKIISQMTIWIGYIMAGFTRKKQALHDMMASTLVINKEAEPQDLCELSTTTPVALIVVAVGAVLIIPVMGILAAIAIPAYQDYTQKAKYAEIDSYAQQATLAFEEYYYANGKVPDSLQQAGVTGTSKYVTNTEITDNGIITFTVTPTPGQKKILLYVPSLNKEQRIVWKCESDDIPEKHLPKRCKQ